MFKSFWCSKYYVTYPWHGWWSQCVLYVPYLTFHWFFSSLNLNDVLILVLDEFRARKIFILVWSNIIWSLQFIWSVPIVCYVSNIYGHIVNAVCEQKATFIPNNSKTRNHFSMQKSFHHFIAYPKHQKISIRLFVIQLLGLCYYIQPIFMTSYLDFDCWIIRYKNRIMIP